MSRPVTPVLSNVLIDRPLAVVYSYYTDMRNFPSFLGDVLEVRLLTETTARWRVALPAGLSTWWTTTITDRTPNSSFAYRTSPLGATTIWSLSFKAEGLSTRVTEQMDLPGGKIGRRLLLMLGVHPEEEQRSNLTRLKQVLETGQAHDDDYTRGKHFPLTDPTSDS